MLLLWFDGGVEEMRHERFVSMFLLTIRTQLMSQREEAMSQRDLGPEILSRLEASLCVSGSCPHDLGFMRGELL